MKWLYTFFHDLPHWNFTFAETTSQFAPSDPNYVQALGLWACVPLLMLLVKLVALLVTWMSRCFAKQSPGSKNDATVAKYSVLVFIIDLICCGFVGVCIFSNEKINRGMDDVTNGLNGVSDTVSNVEIKIDLLNRTLQRNVSSELAKFGARILHGFGPSLNFTFLKELSGMLRQASGSVEGMVDRLDELKNVSGNFNFLNSTITDLESAEYERWWIGLTALLITLAVLFLGLVAVCKRSLSTSLIFSVACLLVFPLAWLAAAASFGGAVAISDLCFNPDAYVESFCQNNLSSAAAQYYLHCNSMFTGNNNPLQSVESLVEGNVNELQNMLKKIVSIVDSVLPVPDKELHEYFDKTLLYLNEVLKYLGHLVAVLDCSSIHTSYKRAMNSLCDNVLSGVALMLLGGIFCGIFVLILLVTVSRTWQLYKRRRPMDYVEVADDQDPFIPRRELNHGSVTADFYGSHVYNPRHRQDTITSSSSTAVLTVPAVSSATDIPASSGVPLWFSTSPPPAYESVQRHGKGNRNRKLVRDRNLD